MARLTNEQADRSFESSLRLQESALERKLNANFNKLSQDIQRAIESHDLTLAEALVGLNDIVLFEILLQAYKVGNTQGARMAARDLEEDDDSLIEEATLLALLLWREDTASFYSREINRTTKKVFDKHLLEAQQEGLSGRQLSIEVAKRTKQENKRRSGTISTTEAQRGTQEGANQAGIEAQVQIMKTWRTQGDRRVRPSHKSANGQTVAMDETFRVGRGEGRFPTDSMLPREEIIGCRCYMRFKKVKL